MPTIFPPAAPAPAPAQAPGVQTDGGVQYHWHIHVGAEGTTPLTAGTTQAPAPTRETHCWLKFFHEGVRPCDTYPEPWLFDWRTDSYVFAKTTPMRDVLIRLGCPQVAGFGIQQVFPQEGRVWGPGQFWAWGGGDVNQTIGNTVLGRGYEGREAWAVRWTNILPGTN